MIRALYACLFLSSLNSFAQLTASYAELKDKFSEEDIVFDQIKSSYEYFVDPQTARIKVKYIEEFTVVPLTGPQTFVWPIFYNDQVTIVDVTLKNSKGKKVKPIKTCGPHSQQGIFHSDAKVCFYRFLAGNGQDRVTMRVEMEYQDPRYFTKISLQEVVATKHKKVTITWPHSIDLELIPFHINPTINLAENNTTNSNSKIYSEYWIDKIENDDHTPGASHFIPHLIPITKGYTISDEYVEILPNTDKLYQWYRQLVSKVDNSSPDYSQVVKELTASGTDKEKIETIYYWVQDNIKYIAFEDGIMGFQPANANEVFYNKYGDCKGMANLLKAMLIEAGFDARLTWLGTNSLPYTYEIPSLAVDNHMICAIVDDENNSRFLDATVKFNSLNYNASNIQGKEVMIEDGDSYLLQSVPLEDESSNFEQFHMNLAIDNQAVTGSGKLIKNGDERLYLLAALSSINKDKHNRFLRAVVAEASNKNDLEVRLASNYRDSTLIIEVDRHSTDDLNSFDNEMYVNLDFRNELADMAIDVERKTPYEFGYRKFIKSDIQFNIPSGYDVKELPAVLTIVNEQFSFDLSYQQSNGMIHYQKKLKVFNTILYSRHFAEWNKAISALKSYYSNPIILHKK